MFLSIISLLCNLPVILIMYYLYKSEFPSARAGVRREGFGTHHGANCRTSSVSWNRSSSKRAIMAVRITDEMAADPEFSEIGANYAKSLRVVLWMSLAFVVIGAVLLNTWITGYTSITLFLAIAPLFLHVYLTNRVVFRARRQLTALKSRLSAQSGTGATDTSTGTSASSASDSIRYVDLVTSRLKNETMPKAAWFLVPALLLSLLWIWAENLPMQLLIGSGYLVIGAAFFLFLMMSRIPIKIYSADSQTNLTLNQAYRQGWGRYWLALAFAVTILHFCLAFGLIRYYESLSELWSLGILLLATMLTLLPVLYAIRVHRRFKALEQRLTQPDASALFERRNEEHYFIEDGFMGFQYNNPENPAFIVNAPVGIGQAINIASKKGRIYYYATKLVICVALLFALGISLFEDISSPQLAVGDEGIRIHQTVYPFRLSAEEIVQIELSDSALVSAKLHKLVGTASKRILRGDFKQEGVGKVKVYVYQDSLHPVIVVHLKRDSAKGEAQTSGDQTQGDQTQGGQTQGTQTRGDQKLNQNVQRQSYDVVRVYFGANTPEETIRLYEMLKARFPEKTAQ